jgi:hypothetical protein
LQAVHFNVDGFFMPFFLQLCRDRRARVLALCVGVALLAGLGLLPFRLAVALGADGGADPATAVTAAVKPGTSDATAAVDPLNDAAITAAVKTGYWFMLAAVALFARAAWRVAVAAWRRHPPGRRELAGALALVLAAGGALLAHERHGYKILADEVLLAGTAMGMHLDREAAYPVRAHDMQGPFQLVQSVLDKRPFLFPFLAALTHDLTGYRAENAFWLNTALGFVFLALVWLLGRTVGGSPWAGALAVLLFAGLPLLGQQMAGGGMDLLNLVLLAAVALLARELAARPGPDAQEALVLGAVLLASARYESALFLAPVAVLVLWGWRRVEQISLTWPVIVAPLLLLPAFWQHRVFAAGADAWELASVAGADVPFALRYLPENLGRAGIFFFDAVRDGFLRGYQPSAPVFSLLGLLALPLFALAAGRALLAPGRAAPAEVALAACGLGLAGITFVHLVHFYGRFDEHVIHRLSLPTHLLLVLAVLTAGARLALAARGWQALGAFALVGVLGHGLPAMARQAYAQEYTPGVEMAWRQEFLKKFPERDYLFIDRDAFYWIVQRISATPPAQAKLRRDNLAWILRNRSFSAMFVFQRLKVDATTGALTVDAPDDLGPEFELEPVWERRIAPLDLDRISRVRAIRAGTGRIEDTRFAEPAPPGPPRADKEVETTKDEYLKEWARRLP